MTTTSPARVEGFTGDSRVHIARGDSIVWAEPDMSIVRGGVRPAPVLPLTDTFGELSTWIAETAESCSAPADYVAASLLAVAASAIGNSRRASPWPGWIEPSILWVALVGASSSGKSPAVDPVLAPLRAVEQERAEEYADTLRRYETARQEADEARAIWKLDVKKAVEMKSPAPEMPSGAVEPVFPEMPRLILSDVTPEAAASRLRASPRGVLCYRDELAGWLSSFGRYSGSQSERPFWLEAYGGRGYVVDLTSLREWLDGLPAYESKVA